MCKTEKELEEEPGLSTAYWPFAFSIQWILPGSITVQLVAYVKHAGPPDLLIHMHTEIAGKIRPSDGMRIHSTDNSPARVAVH